MTVRPQPGEQLVGAYHRFVTECEMVSYNQRSRERGEQMELDVLAVRSDRHETVYACEVLTHLGGMQYSGTPSDDRWAEYGHEGYQYTLETIEKKFRADFDYVTDVFDDAHEYAFQLWSPSVPEGLLTDGLEELRRRLESEFDSAEGWVTSVELVYNERYAARIDELRSAATDDSGRYGNSAFRILQILENVRDSG
jgi:hypothetical protein